MHERSVARLVTWDRTTVESFHVLSSLVYLLPRLVRGDGGIVVCCQSPPLFWAQLFFGSRKDMLRGQIFTVYDTCRVLSDNTSDNTAENYPPKANIVSQQLQAGRALVWWLFLVWCEKPNNLRYFHLIFKYQPWNHQTRTPSKPTHSPSRLSCQISLLIP